MEMSRSRSTEEPRGLLEESCRIIIPNKLQRGAKRYNMRRWGKMTSSDINPIECIFIDFFSKNH